MVVATLAIFLLTLMTIEPAAASPGDLDASFGSGGKVTADFGEISIANAVARDQQGRIVVAGRVGEVSSGDFAVARYDSKGALDDSFGTGGTVATVLTDLEDMPRCVIIQPDGKIVVGGLAGSEGTGDFALARYQANGTLDLTFGTAGIVTTDLSGGLGDGIRGMALLPDGKILAVGAAGPDVGMARYTPDGRLDAGFGSAGTALADFGNGIHAFGLALLEGGRFLIAGNAVNPSTLSDFMLARFEADGGLDGSFGSGGFVTTDFTGRHDLAFDLTVQPDGRIVVVGTANALDGAGLFGDIEFGIARYSSNGSLDASFGIRGKKRINPTRSADSLRSVALQADRKIVVGGFIGEAHGLQSFVDPAVGDFGVARLNPDGTRDIGFGKRGVVRTDFAGSGDGGRDALVHSTGILVVGGATTNHLNFALAQYVSE
jgi:uncharacterized delta-60 repeat protein